MFARRLQVQERLTVQIADFIDAALEPRGVVVVAEGVHMCSVMRGVRKANAKMFGHARRVPQRPAHPRRVHGPCRPRVMTRSQNDKVTR